MAAKILGTLIILTLTIGSGIYQGRLLNRWGTPADLTLAAKSLDRLPLKFGNFTHVSDGEPLSDAVCDELGLVGHLNRTYVNDETGEQMTLLLMVGQPGRLVRHPPHICYTSRGGQQVGRTSVISGLGDDGSSEFKVLKISSSGIEESSFSVAYSHTLNGRWSTPDFPRIDFGGFPYLYKVQVLSNAGSEMGESSTELRGFIDEFINAFEESLSGNG
jgi:hypothetical protein